MTKVVTNPVEALVEVGKENTELHDELHRVYREIDWYRLALTTISTMPNPASVIATKALAHQPFNLQ
jgi:hypothetical protein